MQTLANVFNRFFAILLVGTLLASCASNGEPKAPEPGSKKWYEHRTQEIETAKAAGNLTEEEYLKLKSEADATRQDYIDARNDSTSGVVDLGFGAGFGTGRTHGGPGAQRPSSSGGSKSR
jgi:hypothetical protein